MAKSLLLYSLALGSIVLSSGQQLESEVKLSHFVGDGLIGRSLGAAIDQFNQHRSKRLSKRQNNLAVNVPPGVYYNTTSGQYQYGNGTTYVPSSSSYTSTQTRTSTTTFTDGSASTRTFTTTVSSATVPGTTATFVAGGFDNAESPPFRYSACFFDHVQGSGTLDQSQLYSSSSMNIQLCAYLCDNPGKDQNGNAILPYNYMGLESGKPTIFLALLISADSFQLLSAIVVMLLTTVGIMLRVPTATKHVLVTAAKLAVETTG